MTKQKKKQKRWCQHGLVRWVEQKQQNKLVGFFYCYSISQMTNFELPKYRRHEGIIDGGGPRCSHYLPNTIIEWWENEKKKKENEKQKSWCQTWSCKVGGPKATK